jgi:hypothetical protein
MAESKTPAPRLFLFGAVAGIFIGFLLHNLLAQHQPLLTSKLLDWPFLIFVLLVCLVGLFFDSLMAAISRGELTIGWGKDQSISIRNLSNAVSGELDPIKEDVENLKEAIGRLQTGASSLVNPSPPVQAADDSAGLKAKTIRLREALTNPKYKWRTIERLASIIASSEDDALRLLLNMDDVRLSRSMTGAQIAGLRSRVGSA